MIDIFRQRRNTKLSQKVVSNLVELVFMSKHTPNTSDVLKKRSGISRDFPILVELLNP